MLFSTVLSSTALLAVATAQTAPGFPIQVSQQLSVAYGDAVISRPGKQLLQSDTTNAPTNISTSVFTPSGVNGPDLGVLLMVDKDVNINGTRVQVIHWVATNVKVSPAQSSSSSNSSSNSQRALTIGNSPVPYISPAPPAGDFPHAYSFIFYAQPANFSIPAKYANIPAAIQNRIGFNVVQFVKDLKLGAPLAGNYMLVQNTTAVTSTMSFPPIQTGTATGAATATVSATSTKTGDGPKVTSTATTVPSTGQAGTISVEGRTLWTACLIAVLSGVAASAL